MGGAEAVVAPETGDIRAHAVGASGRCVCVTLSRVLPSLSVLSVVVSAVLSVIELALSYRSICTFRPSPFG